METYAHAADEKLTKPIRAINLCGDSLRYAQKHIHVYDDAELYIFAFMAADKR